MKPALWKALLTHTVPELKRCLWSVGHAFLLRREPQGRNRLCLCSAMWAACYRAVNVGMPMSLIAKIWWSVLLILTLLATDGRMQLDELWWLKSQLVLVDPSRVINWTPTGFFQLPELSFWRWVIDALQLYLTSPALNPNCVIDMWQTGNRCASEPDHLLRSAH